MTAQQWNRYVKRSVFDMMKRNVLKDSTILVLFYLLVLAFVAWMWWQGFGGVVG